MERQYPDTVEVLTELYTKVSRDQAGAIACNVQVVPKGVVTATSGIVEVTVSATVSIKDLLVAIGNAETRRLATHSEAA